VATSLALGRAQENLVHVMFKRCPCRLSVDADTMVGTVSDGARSVARNDSKFAEKYII
jgi:hypothetical protein